MSAAFWQRRVDDACARSDAARVALRAAEKALARAQDELGKISAPEADSEEGKTRAGQAQIEARRLASEKVTAALTDKQATEKRDAALVAEVTKATESALN